MMARARSALPSELVLNSFTTASSAIKAEPTGSAATRKTLDTLVAGRMFTVSSWANCSKGSTRMQRKLAVTPSAIVSTKPRHPSGSALTTAVMRMCSPLCRATTEPSIASQRKSMDATSSDHISGRLKA